MPMLARHELADAHRNVLVGSVVSTVGAAGAEHTEIFDAEVLAGFGSIESIDDENLSAVGDAKRRCG